MRSRSDRQEFVTRAPAGGVLTLRTIVLAGPARSASPPSVAHAAGDGSEAGRFHPPRQIAEDGASSCRRSASASSSKRRPSAPGRARSTRRSARGPSSAPPASCPLFDVHGQVRQRHRLAELLRSPSPVRSGPSATSSCSIRARSITARAAAATRGTSSTTARRRREALLQQRRCAAVRCAGRAAPGAAHMKRLLAARWLLPALARRADRMVPAQQDAPQADTAGVRRRPSSPAAASGAWSRTLRASSTGVVSHDLRLHRRDTPRIPTYEQVSAGGTGHAEAVRVDLRPRQGQLRAARSRIFWHNIDPTGTDRQFCDVGIAVPQRRSSSTTTRSAGWQRPAAMPCWPAAGSKVRSHTEIVAGRPEF